jgi:glycerol-3-phosphate dehydrogenase (NAD(P)+)
MLARKGASVSVWAHEPAVAEQIAQRHENAVYLPGFALPGSVRASARMAEALDGVELVLLVVPSQFVRAVAAQAAPHLPRGCAIVCAAKGIEGKSCLLMSEVLAEVLPAEHHPHLAFLSGPSFAKEVAGELPTAVAIAAPVEENAKRLVRLFATPFFRTYHTGDVVGLEVGGAAKNVIAVAAGISDGLGLGLGARAAIITRGLAEITRLAVAKGAQPATLAGLSGLGDLVLTCTGDLSRNRTLGVRLGRGMSLAEALGDQRSVVEGVENAASITTLAGRLGVELPISNQVYAVIHEGKPARRALLDLMSRELRAEL